LGTTTIFNEALSPIGRAIQPIGENKRKTQLHQPQKEGYQSKWRQGTFSHSITIEL